MTYRQTALSLLTDTRIDQDAEGIETTLDRVDTFRSEAAEAGDLEQVALCDRALDGDVDAYLECLRELGCW